MRVNSSAIPAGTPLQVDLVGPGERRLALLTEKLAQGVTAREAFIVRISGEV